MEIINIALDGITFARMMNCYHHCNIYKVLMKTFLVRFSKCPPPSVVHDGPLSITVHTQKRSALEHLFVCCSYLTGCAKKCIYILHYYGGKM
jgi:hypothetical protein